MANKKRLELRPKHSSANYPELVVDGGQHIAVTDDQADALRAEIALADAAREAFGDVELADLPEGVRLRLTLDEHAPVPKGWEWRTQVAWRSDGVAWCPVEVRPIPKPPAPKTERVPWWEAKGRIVPASRQLAGHPDPWRITRVGDADDGPFCWCFAHGPIPAASDGTVEVLVEGDES